MSKKKAEGGWAYERLSERAVEDLKLVDPLDYLILEKLPNEGELMGGYYPVAETVAKLRKKHFPDLSADEISGRLRSMLAADLTKHVNLGKGDQKGWQITKRGRTVLEAWQQQKKS